MVTEKTITRFRSSLMGLAILLVILHHFTLSTPVICVVSNNGFVGVDIFMILSGFGLFFSMHKDGNVWHFYRRRLRKLLIAYLLFGIAHSLLVSHDTFGQFLFKTSTIGFWFAGDRMSYEWFIPSIILLYALFPLVFRLIESKMSVAVMSFTVAVVSLVALKQTIDFPHFFLVCRVPVFLYGAYLAKQVLEENRSNAFYMVAGVGLVLTIIMELSISGDLHMYYWGRSLMAPAMILCIMTIFSYLPRIERWLSKIGTFTLEIYLMHWIILRLANVFSDKLHVYGDILTIVECIMSILLGYAFNKLVMSINATLNFSSRRYE